MKLRTIEQVSQAWPEIAARLKEEPEVVASQFAEVAYRTLITRPPAIITSQSEDDRNEIIQEIVIHFVSDNCHILRKYSDTGGNFTSWFYTVAYRKAIDFVRKEKKYQTSEPLNDLFVASGGNPGVRYEHKEAVKIARRLISKMQKKCRIMFRALAQGYSYKEIAVLLGLPEEQNKKVADDLRACRDRFRKLLEDQGIGANELAEFA